MSLHCIYNNILRYDIREITKGSLIFSSPHRLPSLASSLLVLISCLLSSLSPVPCLLSLNHRLLSGAYRLLSPNPSFLLLTPLLISSTLFHFLPLPSPCLVHFLIFHCFGYIITEIRNFNEYILRPHVALFCF